MEAFGKFIGNLENYSSSGYNELQYVALGIQLLEMGNLYANIK